MSHVIGDYVYQSPAIGKGTFSKVYYGYHARHRNEVAVKKIRKDALSEEEIAMLRREIDLIKELNHPHVVRYYDTVIDYCTNTVYIITEFCDSNLDKVMRTRSSLEEPEEPEEAENTTRRYLDQVREGLAYLYHHKVFHRDLKPKNILLKSSRNNPEEKIVKIADFGLARQFSDENSLFSTFCGTPLYMAPEVLSQNEYTLVSDLWSFGVILYQMLFKESPFGPLKNRLDLPRKIKEGKIIIPENPKVSEEVKNLVRSLLEVDPTRRLNWDQFLTHKWFAMGLEDPGGRKGSVVDSPQEDEEFWEDLDHFGKTFYRTHGFLEKPKHPEVNDESADAQTFIEVDEGPIEDYFRPQHQDGDSEGKEDLVGPTGPATGTEPITIPVAPAVPSRGKQSPRHSSLYQYLTDSISSISNSLTRFRFRSQSY